MDASFYKMNPSDTIWWVADKNPMPPGRFIFTFDKKKFYNMFKDYPYELTDEEKEVFDKENPFWADFFKNRPRHR